MLDESQTVVLGSSIAGALLALGVYGLFRCYRSRRNVRYERVAHSLDEEEQAFKRTLEMQGDDIDELFEFAHDVQLDQAELEQIEMLERYRGDLIRPGQEKRGALNGHGHGNGHSSDAVPATEGHPHEDRGRRAEHATGEAGKST